MKLAPLALAIALAAAAPFALAQSQPRIGSISGEVLEVLDVEAYTYLRLKTKEGEKWAAVTRASVKKGATVTVDAAAPMPNFESKALGRKFDMIYFGNLGGANAKAMASQPNPHGTSQPAAQVDKVAKATGADARTVAEVIGGSKALKDKSVTVRGKVVKVTSGILGMNWLHIQDGSGKAADNTHDLIVTTKEPAAVGDVVSAKGTVRTDVNVGAGYQYAVLVENASLKK